MSGLVLEPIGPSCPLCEATVPVEGACRSCGLHIPESLAARGLPIQVVQTFGWRQHGKTSYLCALTMTLARMSPMWPESYWFRSLTQRSQHRVREANGHLEHNTLPRRTVEPDEPTVVWLGCAGAFGERIVAFTDSPGEAFEDLRLDVAKVPFFGSTSVTLLIVSLQDLGEDGRGRTLDMLMENLLTSLSDHGRTVEGHSAVVVLTKGDAIPDLPADFRRRLNEDRLWSVLLNGSAGGSDPLAATDLPDQQGYRAYLDELRRVSGDLKRWIVQRADGRNLVQLARAQQVRLELCLVSSTGSIPNDKNHLTVPWHPRRVIDPFLWILELDEGRPGAAPPRRRLRLF